MADWEDIGGWEDVQGRRTPKQMKIGAEGFGEAFTKVFRDAPGWERGLVAAASFPRQVYEGAKQAAGEAVNAFKPKTLSDLVAKRQNPFEDRQAIQAMNIASREEPLSALAGGIAATAPLAPTSILGQAALGGALSGAMPTEQGESRGKNALLGLLTAGGVAAGMKPVAGVVGRMLGRSEASAAARESESAVRNKTIQEAQAIGLKLPPTVTGGGMMAKGLESVAGKAAVAQQASIENQQVINRIARQEAGLGPNEPITVAALTKARNAMAEPYREIAALSPRAKSALEKLQEARLDSKDAWKKYGGPSGGPAERREAIAADNRVSILERLIDKEAKAAGRADLLPALKQARINIAKNHDVESALNVGDGNIEANVIGRILDRRGEKAVTGGLQTIGKFQQAFPKFAREKPTGESAPGVGYLKYPLALGLGAEGYRQGKEMGIGPYGTAAGLLALAGGPARSIALSRMMQRAPQYQPGMALKLADLTAKSPLIPAASVPLSVLMQQQ